MTKLNSMDLLELKKFKATFIIFWIGQLFLLISMFTFDGRFKFLPNILILLTIFNPIGYVLSLISLIKLKGINHHFYLSLVTFGIFVAVGILKSVCQTSTDEFFINWSKGLDWSIAILKCIMYVYFFLGCYHYFNDNGLVKIGKRTQAAVIVIVSLVFLERLSVFLLYFNPIRANIMMNRVLTFGQIIINLVVYCFIFGMLTNLLVNINRKRKELQNNEETK